MGRPFKNLKATNTPTAPSRFFSAGYANSNRNLHLSIFIANGLVFYRSFENVPYPKKPKTTRPVITHNVKERNGLVFLAVFLRMCL